MTVGERRSRITKWGQQAQPDTAIDHAYKKGTNMENKEANQQVNQQEITPTLTKEQSDQIKPATGQPVTELKIGTVEERANPDWLMSPAGS
jgi:hypothetical protein